MFGVGFGGAEVIYRAGILAIELVRELHVPTPELTFVAGEPLLFGALLRIEIFVFHICMTLLAYRLSTDPAWRGQRRSVFSSMVLYHGGVNLIARALTFSSSNYLYALLLWSILTPVHVIIAAQATRRAIALQTSALPEAVG